eukprot:848384-Rhodomonas_salina.1
MCIRDRLGREPGGEARGGRTCRRHARARDRARDHVSARDPPRDPPLHARRRGRGSCASCPPCRLSTRRPAQLTARREARA